MLRRIGQEGRKEIFMSAKDQVTSFFSGFMAGGLIGAMGALLLAPQSGEETRTQIRTKGIELKEKAEVTYADLEERFETTTADLRAQVDELSAKIDSVLAQGKGTLAQKATSLGEAISSGKEPAVIEETSAGA
jgi:gas vesicle protein